MILKVNFDRNHLFVDLGNAPWVHDTGCPVSFGNQPIDSRLSGLTRQQLTIDGKTVDAATISRFTGVTVAGLIGTDILNKYDQLIDLRTNGMELTLGEQLTPPVETTAIGMELLNGTTPCLQATVGGQTGRYIFDTGAKLSYYVGSKPADANSCTPTDDFWIPIGEFQTSTYHSQVTLNGFETTLRFGIPPLKLAEKLKGINVQGILGNELLISRLSGFFPRSGMLYL
jgi:hypothetical protein